MSDDEKPLPAFDDSHDPANAQGSDSTEKLLLASEAVEAARQRRKHREWLFKTFGRVSIVELVAFPPFIFIFAFISSISEVSRNSLGMDILLAASAGIPLTIFIALANLSKEPSEPSLDGDERINFPLMTSMNNLKEVMKSWIEMKTK